MPGPSSRTSNRTAAAASSATAARVIREPGGLCRRALSRRLASTSPARPGLARTASGAACSTSMRTSWRPATGPKRSAAASSSEPGVTASRSSGSSSDSSCASRSMRCTRSVMRSSSSVSSPRKRSRSAGSSEADCSVSAMARAPAIGVRSSCERFATRSVRARWASCSAVTSSMQSSSVARPPRSGGASGATRTRTWRPPVRCTSRASAGRSRTVAVRSYSRVARISEASIMPPTGWPTSSANAGVASSTVSSSSSSATPSGSMSRTGRHESAEGGSGGAVGSGLARTVGVGGRRAPVRSATPSSAKTATRAITAAQPWGSANVPTTATVANVRASQRAVLTRRTCSRPLARCGGARGWRGRPRSSRATSGCVRRRCACRRRTRSPTRVRGWCRGAAPGRGGA